MGNADRHKYNLILPRAMKLLPRPHQPGGGGRCRWKPKKLLQDSNAMQLTSPGFPCPDKQYALIVDASMGAQNFKGGLGAILTQIDA